MELGTKEYYIDAFKHVMMTNLTTSKSQSLASTQSYFAKEIGISTNISAEKKITYLHNLQQAINDVICEVVGQLDE